MCNSKITTFSTNPSFAPVYAVAAAGESEQQQSSPTDAGGCFSSCSTNPEPEAAEQQLQEAAEQHAAIQQQLQQDAEQYGR
jgi:hypothetical protein